MEVLLVLFVTVLIAVSVVLVTKNQRSNNKAISQRFPEVLQAKPKYYPATFNTVSSTVSPPQSKPKAKPKSETTYGTFKIAGYHHLPEDVQKFVETELKTDDELIFIPVDNPYDDEAISVRFKGTHIGYIPKDCRRKKEIHKALKKGKEVKAICVSNNREREYLRAYRPDENGVWNDRYRTGQSVEVKFVKDRE